MSELLTKSIPITEQEFDRYCVNGNFNAIRKRQEVQGDLPPRLQCKRILLPFNELSYIAQSQKRGTDGRLLSAVEITINTLEDRPELLSEAEDAYGLLAELLLHIKADVKIPHQEKNGFTAEIVIAAIAARSSARLLDNIPEFRPYFPNATTAEEDRHEGRDFSFYSPHDESSIAVQTKSIVTEEDRQRYPKRTLLLDLDTISQVDINIAAINHPLTRAITQEAQGKALESETHLINSSAYKLQTLLNEHIHLHHTHSTPLAYTSSS